MKILYLTPALSCPPICSSHLYHEHVIKGLQRRGHSVFVGVLFLQSEAQRDMLEAGVRLLTPATALDQQSTGRLLPVQWMRCATAPYTISKHYSRDVQIAIDAAIKREHFDFIIVEHIQMVQYLGLVARDSCSVLVRLHDLEYVRYWRLAKEPEASWFQKLGGVLESARMFCYERGVLHGRRVAVICRKDQERLERLGHNNSVVIPLFHLSMESEGYTNEELIGQRQALGRIRILFVGPVHHYKNRIALMWFYRDIWPLIVRKVPGAMLTIVNMDTNSKLAAQLTSDSRIEVRAFMADLGKEYRAASVAVAPMRVAGGSSGRVLSALAWGCPVVATPAACEGLEVESGRHLIVADEAAKFADAVISIHSGSSDALALAKNGIEYVRRCHSLDPILDQYEAHAPSHFVGSGGSEGDREREG